MHLYYIPQYLPVISSLVDNGVNCRVILHREDEHLDKIKSDEMDKLCINYLFVDGYHEACKVYLKDEPDWIIFGNGPRIDESDRANLKSKFALMLHGIGPKSIYYDASKYPFDVRFVEGEVRLERLQGLFPNHEFIDTGYAKLDPLFSDKGSIPSIQNYGLSENKKTVLYAPTYFPSSIDGFSEQLPLKLKEYNLIVKPHFFSYTKSKYASHRELFSKWASYDNVYIPDIAEYNLVPFMKVSDIMLSDTSSAMFEFAALDKPLIWCDFLETRWSYRGIFKFRLKNRLDPDLEIFNDFTARADSPAKAYNLINSELENSGRLAIQRKQITHSMVGLTDGKCSDRISSYLLNSLNGADKLPSSN
ncbi:MAG: CDP-glycerol--poly(glycerophosphate) glycerophosphotransferase [Enterobacterales bacterium]|nr:CDP-glycerol--poly(glycerophosphate) glycerophosphotransferase [Enterobacterales bacterium]